MFNRGDVSECTRVKKRAISMQCDTQVRIHKCACEVAEVSVTSVPLPNNGIILVVNQHLNNAVTSMDNFPANAALSYAKRY